MFKNTKIEELEKDVKHLHQVCKTLAHLVDNLQDCLKDQLEINAMVRERLNFIEGEDYARNKNLQKQNYKN